MYVHIYIFIYMYVSSITVGAVSAIPRYAVMYSSCCIVFGGFVRVVFCV